MAGRGLEENADGKLPKNVDFKGFGKEAGKGGKIIAIQCKFCCLDNCLTFYAQHCCIMACQEAGKSYDEP